MMLLMSNDGVYGAPLPQDSPKTNNTNRIRLAVRYPDEFKYSTFDRTNTVVGRFEDIWNKKANILSVDYLSPFSTTMRFLRYEHRSEFEDRTERIGMRILEKSMRYSVREMFAGTPAFYRIRQQDTFLVRIFTDSVGNTEEEEIRPLDISYKTNDVYFWKEVYASKSYKIGLRPIRLDPYAYVSFRAGPHKKPFMFGDVRLHYSKFNEIKYEGLLSFPLGKGYMLSSGFEQELFSDDPRVNVKLYKKFKSYNGRLFVGTTIRQDTRIIAGFDSSW